MITDALKILPQTVGTSLLLYSAPNSAFSPETTGWLKSYRTDIVE